MSTSYCPHYPGLAPSTYDATATDREAAWLYDVARAGVLVRIPGGARTYRQPTDAVAYLRFRRRRGLPVAMLPLPRPPFESEPTFARAATLADLERSAWSAHQPVGGIVRAVARLRVALSAALRAMGGGASAVDVVQARSRA